MSVEIFGVKLEALHTDVSEIKSALDRLSDAITKLALIEQQQTHISLSLERAFKAISKVEDRLVVLEQNNSRHDAATKWVDRVLVGTAGAVMMFVAKSTGLL